MFTYLLAFQRRCGVQVDVDEEHDGRGVKYEIHDRKIDNLTRCNARALLLGSQIDDDSIENLRTIDLLQIDTSNI